MTAVDEMTTRRGTFATHAFLALTTPRLSTSWGLPPFLLLTRRDDGARAIHVDGARVADVAPAMLSSRSASTPGGGEPARDSAFTARPRFKQADALDPGGRPDNDCNGLACCKRRVCGEGRSRGAASQGLPAVQCQAVRVQALSNVSSAKRIVLANSCGLSAPTR